MPKKRMVDLSKAHPFWALAKDGELMMCTVQDMDGYVASVPDLSDSPRKWPQHKPVRVYLVVEDD